MPAPSTYTFSAAALVAAHTAFRDLIDAGTGAGFIRIRDADDVLLAQIPLTIPCGTVDGAVGVGMGVNGGSGRLTLTPAGRDEGADAAGVAAYAEFCDSEGEAHLVLPAAQGEVSVIGFLVLNTLTLVEGGPVEVLGAAVG